MDHCLAEKHDHHYVDHISISIHGWPFRFPFPTNGKQYTKDRLTDASRSAPDSIRFCPECSIRICQALVSGLIQQKKMFLFIMKPEAEPARVVIKLQNISKQREIAFVLWRNGLWIPL